MLGQWCSRLHAVSAGPAGSPSRDEEEAETAAAAAAWQEHEERGRDKNSRMGWRAEKALHRRCWEVRAAEPFLASYWVSLAHLRPRAAFCCYQVCCAAWELFLRVNVPQFRKPWCSAVGEQEMSDVAFLKRMVLHKLRGTTLGNWSICDLPVLQAAVD